MAIDKKILLSHHFLPIYGKIKSNVILNRHLK